MKNSKKIMLYFVSTIVFMVFLLIWFSSCGISNKHKQAIEYMENYNDIENIAYVDNEKIYFSHINMNYQEELAEYDVTKILYVSFDKIYFCSSFQKKVNIYVCNHSFDDVNEIHSYNKEANIINISMVSNDEIWYIDDNGKNVYNIEKNEVQIVDDFPVVEKIYDIHEYTNSIFKQDTLEIKNIQTNEVKIIEISQILEQEVAKRLKEITGCFEIDYAFENGGEIYVNCLSNFVVSTYLYDFKTEKFEFVGWSEAYGSYHVFFLN